MGKDVDAVTDDAGDADREVQTHTERQMREDDGLISYHVIEAVSEATETPIDEMTPLYEVLDPDALDGLFDRNPDKDRPGPNGAVSFRYEECDVTVHTDGRVVVSRPIGDLS